MLKIPPLTEQEPLAVLDPPPLTAAAYPLAVLDSPPLTDGEVAADRVADADHQPPEAGEIVLLPHHHVVRARADV